MSLHYILDGYNLIKHKSFGRSRRSHDERLALVSLISERRLCGSAKNSVTIVFDGYAGPGMAADSGEQLGCRLLFSCDQSADEKIRTLLEHADPANTVVVSDDRQVKFFAKSKRAQVLGVEEFFGGRKTEDGHRTSGKRSGGNAKPELTHSKMLQINKELSDLWLKKTS